MKDKITTIEDLKQLIKQFMEAREWQQYHSPKNMSINIATEAAELMEIFMWFDNNQILQDFEKNRAAIEQEIADVAIGVINFCVRTNIDLAKAITEKMTINGQRYPLEKAKGKNTKYDQLN